MPLTVNEGTQQDVYSVNSGGTEIPVVKLDIGSGTAISDFGGTITEVANLAKGTIIGGTLGNLNFGTVDTFYRHPDAFSTVVTSGTSTLGTIKAGVVGSAIYVTDLIISVGSASNVEIGNGGTANPLLGTLYFNANGGLVSNLRTSIPTGAGSALVYKQSTNGPLTLTVQGYID